MVVSLPYLLRKWFSETPSLGKGKKGEAIPSHSLGGSKGNTWQVSSTGLFKETLPPVSLIPPWASHIYRPAEGGEEGGLGLVGR